MLHLNDVIMMTAFFLGFFYALSLDIRWCKVGGVIMWMCCSTSTFLPMLLSFHRYVIVCHPRLLPFLSAKGIWSIMLVLELYVAITITPFIVYNQFGVDGLGMCGIKPNRERIWIFYYIFYITPCFSNYIFTLIFYRKTTNHIKAMLISGTTMRQTIRHTEDMMTMTKWVALIPLTLIIPAHSLDLTVRFVPIPLWFLRFLVSVYPISFLLDAYVTVRFVGCYRRAVSKMMSKNDLTSKIFALLFRRRATYDEQTTTMRFSVGPNLTHMTIAITPPV